MLSILVPVYLHASVDVFACFLFLFAFHLFVPKHLRFAAAVCDRNQCIHIHIRNTYIISKLLTKAVDLHGAKRIDRST